MDANVIMDGLHVTNMSDWHSRPKRTRAPPPTYWDEYVATDAWYVNKLVEDVPAEEMHAACFDEEFEDDVDSDAEEVEVGEEDTEYIPIQCEEEESGDEGESGEESGDEVSESGDEGEVSGDEEVAGDEEVSEESDMDENDRITYYQQHAKNLMASQTDDAVPHAQG